MNDRPDCWTQNDYDAVLQAVEARLWLFVQANATTHSPRQLIASIAQLSRQELRRVQCLHFLLSEPVQQCIFTDAPAALRRLAQSTVSAQTEVNRTGRGHIDWNQTVKRRYTMGGYDPTLFCAQTAAKSYDTPEVQALRHLLVQVQALCLETLGDVPNEPAETATNEAKWKTTVANLYHACHSHLKHTCLHGVTSDIKLTDAVLERVRRSRNKRFESVYLSLSLYRKLLLQEDMDALLGCMAQRVLKPLDWDTLYEIYVLLTTLAQMECKGWKLEQLHLIGYGKGAVAQFTCQKTTAKVYYQMLPPVFARNSLYTQTLRKYRMDVSLRRPDLLLEFTTDAPRYTLLEVKRTSDRQYIVDSFYKVLGYVKDFESCFAASPLPHGLLVVWSGIQQQALLDSAAWRNDPIALADKDSYTTFLSEILEGGLDGQHGP